MPSLTCENPRSNDQYLPGSPVDAHGGVDSGTLVKVRARIYQSTPPADPPDPTSDPTCRECDADMTGTYWQVEGLSGIEVGSNQLGLWGYFSSAGWCRASPVPLTGIDMPGGGPLGVLPLPNPTTGPA